MKNPLHNPLHNLVHNWGEMGSFEARDQNLMETGKVKKLRKSNQISHGGSAWESNPPAALFRRHTGFEVREPHQ